MKMKTYNNKLENKQERLKSRIDLKHEISVM